MSSTEVHYGIDGNVPCEAVCYETRIPENYPVVYPCTVWEGVLFVFNDTL